jgi:hypothetical protein
LADAVWSKKRIKAPRIGRATFGTIYIPEGVGNYSDIGSNQGKLYKNGIDCRTG